MIPIHRQTLKNDDALNINFDNITISNSPIIDMIYNYGDNSPTPHIIRPTDFVYGDHSPTHNIIRPSSTFIFRRFVKSPSKLKPYSK